MRKDLSALAEHLSAIRNMLFWVSKMAQWVKAASAGKTDDLGHHIYTKIFFLIY